VRGRGGERWRFSGVTRKHVSERGLDSGLVGEEECEARNASRGSGVATVAGDGDRRRGAARDDGEQSTSTRRWGRGEEVAGEHPHSNTKLLECLLDGGERRSDGNDGGRSAEAAVAGKALALRVFRAERRLRLGGEARARRRFK
jgi:hypothetical protein